ncbi:MAG TPA: hypothetical protein VF499_14375 [Afipia sp.]
MPVPTIAVTLSAMGLLAATDANAADQRYLSDLLDQGFNVVSEGKLISATVCNRFTMRVIPSSSNSSDSCETKYGSFKRVKKGDDEFVCVSFPDWSCHQSKAVN